jgi:hypothetical protein
LYEAVKDVCMALGHEVADDGGGFLVVHSGGNKADGGNRLYRFLRLRLVSVVSGANGQTGVQLVNHHLDGCVALRRVD